MAAMSKTATLTVQRWGNSLAVRIPAAIARSAKLTAGQPVEVSLQDDEIVVKCIGVPKLSLAQKLALFDPAKHGGEEMAAPLVGAEVF
jgi:antitoxin MazE